MSEVKKTVLALVAVTITVGYLWHTHRDVTPRTATLKEVLTEAQQGGYQIIDTGTLWNRYQKNPDTLLLVDTRQEWEYRTGHIKGALNFPMEPTWLSRWRNKGALAKILGADKNRFIVFY